MKTFGGILRKGDANDIKKHWVSQSNVIRLRDIGKSNYSNGKIAFRKLQELSCANLINSVVYEDVWSTFTINGKTIPKSIWFLSQT